MLFHQDALSALPSQDTQHLTTAQHLPHHQPGLSSSLVWTPEFLSLNRAPHLFHTPFHLISTRQLPDCSSNISGKLQLRTLAFALPEMLFCQMPAQLLDPFPHVSTPKSHLSSSTYLATRTWKSTLHTDMSQLPLWFFFLFNTSLPNILLILLTF